MTKDLYVVFSSTPNKMGTLIRGFTGGQYNHVSISLDADLGQMYSFARRYYHTPFYGGFVKESISRYHINGQSARIRVCRIPITQEQYQTLEAHLADMLKRQDRYLYNHLSAITVPLRRRVKVRDAYICVDFVAQLLQSLGIGIDPGRNYAVDELEQLLRPYAVYTGPAPEAKIHDTTYFAPKPIPHPIITSAMAFLELCQRLLEE